MGLWIYLYRKKWVSYDEGETHTIEDEELYSTNITHNLIAMADEAGIYKALWHPEELGITTAGRLIPIFEMAIVDMKARPDFYKKLNPANGWGSYNVFIPWIAEYLQACKENPEALVRASG